MAYSVDLREKVISRYESGESTQLEIAELFGIGISTFKRWNARKKRGQTLNPLNTLAGRPSKIDDAGLKIIKILVEKNPSITLAELSELFFEKHHVIAGRSILSRALQKLNLRYKKLSIQSHEAQTPEVKKKRRLPKSNS